jgi:serine/threonine-protein kinase RsbT
MVVKSQEIKKLLNEDDIMHVRGSVKRIVSLLNFSLVNQTKVVTASSELARNIIEHGKGGEAVIQIVNEYDRTGVRIIFSDTGPGISDIDKAMEDGFTTGGGMGLGLGGAKRLMDEFEIKSSVDEGTEISVTKWMDA